MARVAARALALARRRVAGRADWAVTGTAAEHRDSRGTQEFRRARCQRAGAKLVQPSDRWWDSLRTFHSVAGEPPRGIRGTSGGEGWTFVLAVSTHNSLAGTLILQP